MDARALQSTPSRRQQGSALFVSLMFLVILTILGVSSMGTARLELKMAANTQFANQAFQASESGIEATLRETDIYATADTDGVDHAYCFNQVERTEQWRHEFLQKYSVDEANARQQAPAEISG